MFTYFDTVRQGNHAFAILVPLTNFPPVHAPSGRVGYGPKAFEAVRLFSCSSLFLGPDIRFGLMQKAEHRYEYFFVVSFVNGGEAEIYCGHTSFVPQSILPREHCQLSDQLILEEVSVTLTPMPGSAPPPQEEQMKNGMSNLRMEVAVLLPKDGVVLQGTIEPPSSMASLTDIVPSRVLLYRYGKSN